MEFEVSILFTMFNRQISFSTAWVLGIAKQDLSPGVKPFQKIFLAAERFLLLFLLFAYMSKENTKFSSVISAHNRLPWIKDIRCLHFTQTTQLEILSTNIKLQKLRILMWWENDPLKRIFKSAEQTEKRRKCCIDHLKWQPIFSVASQTEWHTMNHWIFQLKLPVFPCTVVSVLDPLKDQIKGPIGVKLSKSDSGGQD